MEREEPPKIVYGHRIKDPLLQRTLGSFDEEPVKPRTAQDEDPGSGFEDGTGDEITRPEIAVGEDQDATTKQSITDSAKFINLYRSYDTDAMLDALSLRLEILRLRPHWEYTSNDSPYRQAEMLLYRLRTLIVSKRPAERPAEPSEAKLEQITKTQVHRYKQLLGEFARLEEKAVKISSFEDPESPGKPDRKNIETDPQYTDRLLEEIDVNLEQLKETQAQKLDMSDAQWAQITYNIFLIDSIEKKEEPYILTDEQKIKYQRILLGFRMIERAKAQKRSLTVGQILERIDSIDTEKTKAKE